MVTKYKPMKFATYPYQRDKSVVNSHLFALFFLNTGIIYACFSHEGGCKFGVKCWKYQKV